MYPFHTLKSKLQGELLTDRLHSVIYATDASVYRELPEAVAYPKNTTDIQEIVRFAKHHKLPLIPRAAGTSLAGQCVGRGLVVDVSKHMTRVLNFDSDNRTITVQPGVIRDDLNRKIIDSGLFFGPNTSTSNRCMIGGMVGNNSSGTTSIKYGVTRDKILELQTILSDGSEVIFKALSKDEFVAKTKLDTLEGEIYRNIFQALAKKSTQEDIQKYFPKPEIHRRNTGYAVDELLNSAVFSSVERKINMCDLLAGSEGTLAFTTAITLKLDELPPQKSALVAAHFSSIEYCLQAVEPVMKHGLFTCEMMDKVILDCTKSNLKYQKNRFFIDGDPEAILLLEIRADDEANLQKQLGQLLKTLKQQTESYATPILRKTEITQAMELRKAGLGLLANLVGDKKAVACIEDTAVALPDLAAYISEFTAIMKRYDQKAVYYAHAGAGELHLRPILNLKKSADVRLFKQITQEVAHLVKKYRGAMSGEHGDGRVRAQFIEEMIGRENYELLRQIKSWFDPQGIFNPGKIIDPAPMDTSLRYVPDRQEPGVETFLDFSDSEGILRHAERCNGSGDCRKSAEAGGTMCPSYRATRNEKDTTRARANALREILTQSEQPNMFDSKALKNVFDLCVSCKGCHNECPSNVDVATLKAEFQYQYKKTHGSSLRTKVFAHNYRLNKMASFMPRLYNVFCDSRLTSKVLKYGLGVAPKRSLPKITRKSLTAQIRHEKINLVPAGKPIKTVYLFVDEFTEYLDTAIGVDAIRLLVKLGYRVKIEKHAESGRSYISKGFLEEAKVCADKNIAVFKTLLSKESPLLGIEPSAILSFRDEYLRLASDKDGAEKMAKHALLIDEFLQAEIKAGNIVAAQFTSAQKTIKLHGHCHQKALSNSVATFDLLNLPKNYKVTIIPSGCCGMAGSFGYEKEHYEVSMAIGEQTLFPAVRKSDKKVIIAAPGTSCRHQIKDGTQRQALHPISIFYRALK